MPKVNTIDVAKLPKELQAQVLKAVKAGVKPKAVVPSVSTADLAKAKAHLLRYRKVAMVVNERNGKVTFHSPNHTGWKAFVGGKGTSEKAPAAKPKAKRRSASVPKPAKAATLTSNPPQVAPASAPTPRS